MISVTHNENSFEIRIYTKEHITTQIKLFSRIGRGCIVTWLYCFHMQYFILVYNVNAERAHFTVVDNCIQQNVYLDSQKEISRLFSIHEIILTIV